TKLLAFQKRDMQKLPVADKVTMALPYLQRAGLVPDPEPAEAWTTLTHIVTEAGPRLSVAGDILDYADFFLPADQLPCDDRAFDKHVRRSPELLRRLRGLVATVEPFDAAALKKAVEGFAEAEGVKHGPLSQTLRVAVTGKEVGFGAYETLEVLGR